MVYVYIGLMSIFKFPETRDTQPLLYLWSNIFKYPLVFHYNIILQPLFLSVRFQFKDLFKFIKYWSVHEFLQLFWIQLLFPLHWLIFTFSYSILAYSSDINQITWSPEKKKYELFIMICGRIIRLQPDHFNSNGSEFNWLPGK